MSESLIAGIAFRGLAVLVLVVKWKQKRAVVEGKEALKE